VGRCSRITANLIFYELNKGDAHKNAIAVYNISYLPAVHVESNIFVIYQLDDNNINAKSISALFRFQETLVSVLCMSPISGNCTQRSEKQGRVRLSCVYSRRSKSHFNWDPIVAILENQFPSCINLRRRLRVLA